MKTLKQYKTEQMKNSAFTKEYEAIQSEMDKIGGGADGGKDYLKRVGYREDWEELSECKGE